MASVQKIKQRKIHVNVEDKKERRVCGRVIRDIEKDNFVSKNDEIEEKTLYKKVKGRKLKDYEKERREEEKLDKVIENEDNFSIGLIVLILVICFAVGILVGYILYQLAIDSSNVLLIGRHFLH